MVHNWVDLDYYAGSLSNWNSTYWPSLYVSSSSKSVATCDQQRVGTGQEDNKAGYRGIATRHEVDGYDSTKEKT